MTDHSASKDSSALRLIREMLLIRLVEETMAARYAEQEMRCPVHLSIGQEATAVGVCQALRVSDRVFSTHRCHAHYLAKGGDLKAMLAEIYGKAAGCIGGRGGSMHLTDPEKGMIASVPIVASSIPLAVGSALASRIDHTDDVSVAFIGDASIEEGVFHESANFASLNKLPVLFVCENNLYSVYTNLHDRQPSRPLTNVAVAHDMHAAHADGNDVEAVLKATLESVERARSGAGPSFLQFDTYRWREHCGPNFDNTLGYRTVEEYEEWRAKCPIELTRRKLRALNLLSEADEKRMTAELQTKIDAAFEFAKAGPLPNASEASSFVYA
ncbi:MAG: thiamine pyrophosphate-dependent dehydrogenase E1 component subunit alpha [Woeseiaceae bacterium]